jgi:hypothetical protein
MESPPDSDPDRHQVYLLSLWRETPSAPWLWLATQVTREREQSYCLQQALRINPRSESARRGLAQLQRRPGEPIDFKR